MPEGPDNQSPVAVDDTLGSQSGLAAVQLAGATVAVLDNAAVVDTRGGSSAESDNIQATLAALGHTPVPFADISAEGFAAALSGADVLLFPEMEIDSLIRRTTTDANDVIRNYVEGGGTLVFSDPGSSAASINSIFGLSLTVGSGARATITENAEGTTFEGSVGSVPDNNATSGLRLDSLPEGSLSLYANASASTVAAIPFGEGQIISLGWDWFNAQPVGSLNGGWVTTLDRSISVVSDGIDFTADAPSVIAAADLLENDADPDDEPVTISGVSATSALGAAVTLAGDGTITYDPTGVAALQALAEDAELEDSFTYTVSDGFGGTDTATVTLSVAGPDADPVLTGTLEDQSAYFGTDFSLVIPADLFTDLSGGRLGYDVTLAGGGALPDWLMFDAATRTLSFDDADMSPADIGDLDLRVTATEEDGQSASLSFALSVVGAQVLVGTDGPDALTGLAGPDIIVGLGGDDTLLGGDSGDDINGGGGADSIDGGTGNDTIGAGDGDDTVEGGIGFDQIFGGGGADSLSGGAGRDVINGMDGNDTVAGGTQDDTLGGQDGDDSLMGGEGGDFLSGGAGNDTMRGDDGIEGNFSDSLYGGEGADLLFGGGGRDLLEGGDGDDLLLGSYGSDELFGGAGDDFLFGGLGFDTVTGGDGADRFFLSGVSGDRMVITDFDPTEGDVIVFDGAKADRSNFTFLQRVRSEIDDLGNETLIYEQRDLLFNGRTVVTFFGDDPIAEVTLRLPDPSDTGQIITFDLG